MSEILVSIITADEFELEIKQDLCDIYMSITKNENTVSSCVDVQFGGRHAYQRTYDMLKATWEKLYHD